MCDFLWVFGRNADTMGWWGRTQMNSTDFEQCPGLRDEYAGVCNKYVRRGFLFPVKDIIQSVRRPFRR